MRSFGCQIHGSSPLAILSLCVGCITLRYNCVTLLQYLVFYPMQLTFQLPVFTASVVSSSTHKRDIELLVFCLFLALYLYPLLILYFCLPFGLLVPSCCWSISWSYRTTDCTRKQKPCPPEEASPSLLRFSFIYFKYIVFFWLLSVRSSCTIFSLFFLISF